MCLILKYFVTGLIFYVLLLNFIVLYLISSIIIFPSFLTFDAAACPLGVVFIALLSIVNNIVLFLLLLLLLLFHHYISNILMYE
jgi:hypothetical protein